MEIKLTEEKSKKTKYSNRLLFITFLKLGLFTIGGGIAMIPILQNEMVNVKKWFTNREMLDIISICQSLPGVIAVNMATYVGFKKRGLLGSFVATLGVVLPSFIIIIAVAKGLAQYGDNRYVIGVLTGLRAAVVGLIIIAVYNVGKGVIKNFFTAAEAAASLIAIAYFKVSVIYIVIVFVIIGIANVLYSAEPAENDRGIDE